MATLFVILFLISIVVLVVGLIKPSNIYLETRKQVGKWCGSAILMFFILIAIASPSKSAVTSPIASTETIATTTAVIATQSVSTPVAQKKVSAPTPVEQAPAQTPQPPKTTPAPTQPAPAIPSETISQKNAVAKAISYLNYTAFSHDGLVDQLEYDQFSQADAVYGVDNSGADWNKQAAAKAKVYMAYSAFSRGSLISQLEYDKFTQAQAEYGANAVGL